MSKNVEFSRTIFLWFRHISTKFSNYVYYNHPWGVYTEEQEELPLHWLTGKELPAILPEEKEKELIQKLGTDNDKKARDELTTHNLRLVVWAAEKYKTDSDMEELLAAGTFGLVKAIDSYDPVQRKRIATYAAHCIENEMKMYLRKQKKIQVYETEMPEEKEKAGYGDPVAKKLFSIYWQRD